MICSDASEPKAHSSIPHLRALIGAFRHAFTFIPPLVRQPFSTGAPSGRQPKSIARDRDSCPGGAAIFSTTGTRRSAIGAEKCGEQPQEPLSPAAA